tara:strand:- start:5608 stop:6375 length:768 start_codon:yes stop_codon:yes gene_type:complete
MIKKNFIKEKLKKGKPVIGTWSIIPSSINAEIMSSSGLDFIILDQEHGPINFETAQNACSACELHNTSPLMRIGDINKPFIQNALDIGVHGIQIPNIETKEDAKKVVEYSKYPPQGDRGLSPFTRAGLFDGKNSSELTSQANENTLVVLNIEGKGAVNNLDDILEVEGFDTIFVGLFDLSKSLGIPGEVNSSEVIKTLEKIIKKTIEAGKTVGTIATSHETLETFLSLGATYLVYSVDCDVLRNEYSKVVEIVNK